MDKTMARKCHSSHLVSCIGYPEAPARHLDVSRQKLTPHCLATILASQLPSPKLSPKMPPKLFLTHKRGHFSSFKITPTVRVIARQLRDKIVARQFCLACCATPPEKFGVAPPPPLCREVSHRNLGLTRCRATRGCRSYSCGCRATLCN